MTGNPLARRLRPARPSRTGLEGTAVAGAAMCVVAAACAGPPAPHGDPDPGGHIMRAVSTVEVAVPADARVLRSRHVKPRWDSCDARPETFGWSDVVVLTEFATAEAPSALISKADARLTQAGWTRDDEGRRYARWSRPAPGGQATALLSPDDTQTSGLPRWDLYAAAPSIGELPPARQGC